MCNLDLYKDQNFSKLFSNSTIHTDLNSYNNIYEPHFNFENDFQKISCNRFYTPCIQLSYPQLPPLFLDFINPNKGIYFIPEIIS